MLQSEILKDFEPSKLNNHFILMVPFKSFLACFSPRANIAQIFIRICAATTHSEPATQGAG